MTRRAFTTSLRLTSVEEARESNHAARSPVTERHMEAYCHGRRQSKLSLAFSLKCPRIFLSFTHENPHIPVGSCNLAGDLVRIQTANAASRHVRRLDPVGILRTVGSCQQS